MPICNHGRRINCVVDGDTIWVDGEKIRLDSINAPEVQGRCDRERVLAARATERLSGLLSADAFEIARKGKDRYDRTLARVTISGRDVGTTLIGEGLAHAWHGQKRSWCSGP
ncbi:MAG: thermonuclease family protein [Pseudorhodoplanes sp.]|nr:thermonuclease family protein [Pseudorhodoplanes sp.]